MQKVYNGMKVNFLTVIDDKRFHKNGDCHQGYYLCKCECGNEKLIKDTSLCTGRIRDCGCGEFLRKRHIGEKYGTMEVIDAYREKRNNRICIFLKCKCSVCGTEKTFIASDIKNKNFSVCRCNEKRKHSKRNKFIGIDNRLVYCWKNMIDRCYNEFEKCYNLYGGRGIIVCDEWKNSANAFFKWAMSNGYADNLTIDRIDPNGNYCPENCRWITKEEQTRNTTKTRKFEWKGKLLTVAEIARIENISQFTLYCRLNRGLTIQEAVRKNE